MCNPAVFHVPYFPDHSHSSDGQSQTSDNGKSVCMLRTFTEMVLLGISITSSTCVNVYIGIADADCRPDACWLYDPLISVPQNTTTPTPALQDLRGLSAGSDDDLMLMACDLPQLPAPANFPLHPQLLPPPQGGGPNAPWGFGGHQLQLPATGKLACCLLFLLLVLLVLSFPISLRLVVTHIYLSRDFSSASFSTLDLDSVCLHLLFRKTVKHLLHS